MDKGKKGIQDDAQINDLIFKELIKRGYSLEGRTRVWNIADSKLWYLTPEQAQAYLDLEGSPKYKKEMIDAEMQLIKESMPEINKRILNEKKEIIIIDIGCGDGKKAIFPIDSLKDKAKIIYCPIDISGYMVERAIKNIKKTDVAEIVQFQWNISDFENLENVTRVLRIGGRELFMLFLGSTLGNFEMHEVLYSIKVAMEGKDYILIGVALNKPDHKNIEETYTSKYSRGFLFQVLEQVGFSQEDVEFGARFKNSRIESFFTLKKDKTIKFQNRQINFSTGDMIIVSYSYKYEIKTFLDSLKLYFGELVTFLNKEKTWALVLCKK